jgi:hypothetical protein
MPLRTRRCWVDAGDPCKKTDLIVFHHALVRIVHRHRNEQGQRGGEIIDRPELHCEIPPAPGGAGEIAALRDDATHRKGIHIHDVGFGEFYGFEFPMDAEDLSRACRGTSENGPERSGKSRMVAESRRQRHLDHRLIQAAQASEGPLHADPTEEDAR